MLLLLVSLALKNSNSSPKSFLFEQDVYGNWRTTFQDIEKSDLVWKYAFQNCRQASKIHKASRLLRSRALIIMLLILGCVESHPGPSMSFNVGKFSYIFFSVWIRNNQVKSGFLCIKPITSMTMTKFWVKTKRFSWIVLFACRGCGNCSVTENRALGESWNYKIT